MKAALYARVSTGYQESENQLLELRAYCERQGWEIAREYVDEDVSGKKPKPELERLLRDAHERRFDLVVFWALDRLTRRGVQEALDILGRLTAARVDYVSYREPYLSSLGPWREAIVAVIATIAKVESARFGDRVRSGLARARAQGKRIGRPPASSPVEPTQIAQERAKGASWGEMARKYSLPRTSVRRLYQKGLVDIGRGHGRSESGK